MPHGSPPVTNPLEATGYLFRMVGEVGDSPMPKFTPLGSCFAFRDSRYFLTASHCLRGVPDAEVAVYTGFTGMLIGSLIKRARAVVCHPSADVALLEVRADHQLVPFWHVAENLTLGEEFMAYGFPEDTFGEHERAIAYRFFRGHFQRFMPYRSPVTGFSYEAIELNVATPGGLSGAPLFRPNDHSAVAGIVTENLQSRTGLDSWTQVVEPGHTRVIESYQLISYGVALRLAQVTDWLDQHTPIPKSPPLPHL